MSDTSTVVGFVHKDLPIEQFVLRWPITAKRLEEREDRTLLRERNIVFIDYPHLHEVMFKHDTKVLAKWLMRKLHRQKAVLINSPRLFVAHSPLDWSYLKEVHIVQDAIKYDEDAYEKFGKQRVMVSANRRSLTIAVMTDPPVAAWVLE
jgi:hypothetical protein